MLVAMESPAYPSLALRDRMLTELQENGRVTWPAGWPLSLLIDLVTTLGIETNLVCLHGSEIVVTHHV